MSNTVKLLVGTLDATSGELTAGSMARAIDDKLMQLVPPGANEDLHGRRKLALASHKRKSAPPARIIGLRKKSFDV